MRRFHALAAFSWAAILIPTLLWWRDSVLLVLVMSLWANVIGHWSAWQATRAEDASK